jgi:hypothetical protein
LVAAKRIETSKDGPRTPVDPVSLKSVLRGIAEKIRPRAIHVWAPGANVVALVR